MNIFYCWNEEVVSPLPETHDTGVLSLIFSQTKSQARESHFLASALSAIIVFVFVKCVKSPIKMELFTLLTFLYF